MMNLSQRDLRRIYLSSCTLARRRGHLSEADERASRMLKEMDARLEDESSIECDALLEMGDIRVEQNRFDEAQQFYRKALRKNEECSGHSHPKSFAILLRLANVMHQKGQSEEEAEMIERSLSIPLDKDICRELDLIDLIEKNASSSMQRSAYSQAEALAIRALAMLDDQYESEQYPKWLSFAGLACLRQGKYIKAEQLYREAIDKRQTQAVSSIAIAFDMKGLGKALCGQSRIEEAMKICEDALALREEFCSDKVADSGTILCELAQNYCSKGNHACAAELCDEALSADSEI